jgi:hypothetical protein
MTYIWCHSADKQHRQLNGGIVHVKAGKPFEDFAIHQNLLCHCSPFFKAAFTSNFKESKDGVMELPGTAADVFKLFCHRLYSGSFWESDEDHDSSTLKRLIRLYIFADMARIPQLMNGTLRALEEVMGALDTCAIGELKYVWRNTTTTSPLRRFLIDVCVWGLNKSAYAEDFSDHYTKEICMALLQAWAAKDEGQPESGPLLDMSNYDVQEEDDNKN